MLDSLYFTANEMLKKKNEELQLMILQARTKVAETTDGFQHYTTVFGGGANNHRHCTTGDAVAFPPSTVATTTATMAVHRETRIGITAGNDCACDKNHDDGFPILPEFDDDDHALSFLWS